MHRKIILHQDLKTYLGIQNSISLKLMTDKALRTITFYAKYIFHRKVLKVELMPQAIHNFKWISIALTSVNVI